MSQIDLSDPRFGIKIISPEEALSKIPMEILITKVVDLYRRTHGKEPLLKPEGGWASALNEERMKTGATITYEIIRPEKVKGVPCSAPQSFIKSMNEAFGEGVEQTEWYLDGQSVPLLQGMSIMAGDKEPYNFLIEKIRKHGDIKVSYQY